MKLADGIAPTALLRIEHPVSLGTMAVLNDLLDMEKCDVIAGAILKTNRISCTPQTYLYGNRRVCVARLMLGDPVGTGRSGSPGTEGVHCDHSRPKPCSTRGILRKTGDVRDTIIDAKWSCVTAELLKSTSKR
jgi:hypothetical protein